MTDFSKSTEKLKRTAFRNYDFEELQNTLNNIQGEAYWKAYDYDNEVANPVLEHRYALTLFWEKFDLDYPAIDLVAERMWNAMKNEIDWDKHNEDSWHKSDLGARKEFIVYITDFLGNLYARELYKGVEFMPGSEFVKRTGKTLVAVFDHNLRKVLYNEDLIMSDYGFIMPLLVAGHEISHVMQVFQRTSLPQGLTIFSGRNYDWNAYELIPTEKESDRITDTIKSKALAHIADLKTAGG
ncbi:MAG: hypothetical protein FWD33_03315 [Alphaproteobacteria bacterium]|nr:hypothetical protein [Alphaproteobacteria bacterium]